MQPFHDMTVRENVMVGELFGHAVPKTLRAAQRDAEETCALVGLAPLMERDVLGLGVADLKRLEIARALATHPRLLLLDEVMAGLTPTESAQAVGVIRAIRDRGVTVLLIDHVMSTVRDLAERVAGLNFGRKIAEGTFGEVAHDPAVIEAYLGVGRRISIEALLAVEGLRAGYGRVPVLIGVAFHVQRGEIVCLVGANGAGKTTLLRAMSWSTAASRWKAAGRSCSGRGHATATDVSSPDQVRTMIGETVRALGGLHILVNNAGLQDIAPIVDYPEDHWNYLIGVMLTGTFLCTKYALPHMQLARWGRVVHIASAHGLVASRSSRRTSRPSTGSSASRGRPRGRRPGRESP